MRDFSLELPVNSVSFGQVSVALLREFHARGLQPCLFPIGDNIDLNCQGNPLDKHPSWKITTQKSTGKKEDKLNQQRYRTNHGGATIFVIHKEALLDF